ncbi:MAG TPA: hypothetical protein VMM58_02715 [Bacteroidota bacterium]|nr:hypothetical protein [Bacteroidota bacterium]
MNDVSIFHLANIKLPMEKNRFLLMFAGVNLIFTGLDVALAHSINSFVPPYEWIPVYFAPVGAFTCFILAFQLKPTKIIALAHIFLMCVGVLVGVVGMGFHLSQVLSPTGRLSWAWVVFGSPILAPLSFAGISLIGLYGVTTEVRDRPGMLEVPGLGLFQAPISRDRHFMWLVGLGFAGSAITSIIDHAQYGYTLFKLIPVAYGVFATAVVLYLSIAREWSHGDELTYFWTMVAAVVVGVLGFAFHLSRDLTDTGQISMERILVFAPVFAPLLFCDLGILGLLVVSKSAQARELRRE